MSTDFIRGMGKVKGKVKILLDIEKVLSREELGMMGKLGDTVSE